MIKKVVITILLAVLGGLSFLILRDYLGSSSGQSALISRFYKPKEIKVDFEKIKKVFLAESSEIAGIKNGKILLYNRSGKLSEVSPSGQVQDKEVTANLFNIVLSAQKNFLIGQALSREFVIMDLKTGDSKNLPFVESLSFSEDEKTAAYIYREESGDATIRLADVKFLSFKKLLSVRGLWSLNWKDSKTLYLQHTDNEKTSLFTLDIDSQALSKIFSSSGNITILPNSINAAFIYSKTEDGVKKLYYNSFGSISGDRNYEGIVADSCVWASDNSLYCVNDRQDFLRIPIDGDPEKITLNSGIKIKTDRIFLSSDEKLIYFKNLLNGSLYSLSLD